MPSGSVLSEYQHPFRCLADGLPRGEPLSAGITSNRARSLRRDPLILAPPQTRASGLRRQEARGASVEAAEPAAGLFRSCRKEALEVNRTRQK